MKYTQNCHISTKTITTTSQFTEKQNVHLAKANNKTRTSTHSRTEAINSETKDTKQTIEAITATINRYILALCINQRVIEGDNELKKSSKGEVLVKI